MLILLVLACSETTPSPTVEPVVVPEEQPAPVPVQLPDPTEPRYSASHILIAFAGAVGAPSTVTRSREEARALAEQLLTEASDGDFTALAREHSDGPSAPRGGRIGVYPTGTMEPAFERSVASVEPGRIGPLVESPFGFHIVRRDAIEEVEVAHILVPFAGSRRSEATRSRAEAETLIAALKAELDGGADFAAVARRSSEDGSAPAGGHLGRIAHGQMVPAFEDAAFALEVGQRSEVVETPYGLHLLLRTK